MCCWRCPQYHYSAEPRLEILHILLMSIATGFSCSFHSAHEFITWLGYTLGNPFSLNQSRTIPGAIMLQVRNPPLGRLSQSIIHILNDNIGSWWKKLKITSDSKVSQKWSLFEPEISQKKVCFKTIVNSLFSLLKIIFVLRVKIILNGY